MADSSVLEAIVSKSDAVGGGSFSFWPAACASLSVSWSVADDVLLAFHHLAVSGA